MNIKKILVNALFSFLLFVALSFVLQESKAYAKINCMIEKDDLRALLKNNTRKMPYYYSILLNKSTSHLTVSAEYTMVKELEQNGCYNYLYDEYVDVNDAFLWKKKLLVFFPMAKVVLVKEGLILQKIKPAKELIYESALVSVSSSSNIDNDEFTNYYSDSKVEENVEFSVQIFVSGYNRDVNEFNIPGVYMQYIDGLYKYRIGHYETYADAMVQLNKIRGNGFETAFVVKK